MTEEKIFGFRLEAARKKVRYGRAVLTVQRSGVVVFTPIVEELEKYREGRVGADDVAWAFVRTRVVAHSPSFDWGSADINKLLPLITAVTEDPKIEARSPADLVLEMEALKARDLKELDADRQRFAELSALLPEMSSLAAGGEMSSPVQLIREDGAEVSDATRDWRLMEILIQSLFRPETIADEAAFYKETAKMLDSEPFARLSTATGFTLSARLPAEAWTELEALVKQVEDPTISAVIRHGMEALGNAEGSTSEAALKELTAAIDSLQVAIEGIGDSPQRAILLAVTSSLLTLLIQAALAKLGIKL